MNNKFESSGIVAKSTAGGARFGVDAVAAAALAAAGFLAVLPASAQVATATDSRGEYVRGRVLVGVRAGLADAELGKIVGVHGGRARAIGRTGVFIVDLPAQASETAVVQQLARNPHLKFAELDRRGRFALVPSDPYAGSQWHTTLIGAPTAWDASQGSGITIAILDTGVDGTHPDLALSMVPGWNFDGNNSNTSDVYGHGTKAAGAAAAVMNNSTGVAGVAGKARIMPIRIGSSSGFSYSAVAQGLTFAADNGARVANMSIWGALGSSAVRTAADYMKNKGGLVVTSAGNDGADPGWSPSTAMITVSATDSNDARTSWSNYGSYVVMSAPGVGVWTTTMGGGYAAVNGTSFSSPVTSGVVALMMAANPKLSNLDVEKLLYSTAVDLGTSGRDAYFGYGRVDAAAAVKAALAASTISPTPDTSAPTVAIGAPLAGSTVSGLAAVNVSANDNVGVSKVELRVNGTVYATDTSSPYAFSWDSARVANGSVNLQAVAYDAAGNAGASATTTVTVSNSTPTTDTIAPNVAIIEPAEGARVGSNKTTVKADGNDNGGIVGVSMSLYVNGNLVAMSKDSSTLRYNWDTRRLLPGTHTLRVDARDAAGNTRSTSRTVYK